MVSSRILSRVLFPQTGQRMNSVFSILFTPNCDHSFSYLYNEKVLITFNYKDGTKTITFDEIAAKDAPEGNGSDLGCFAPPKNQRRKYAGFLVYPVS